VSTSPLAPRNALAATFARIEEWMREKAPLLASEMTGAELASEAWIRLAGRDGDAIAVNAETGGVFEVAKDGPSFRLLASSVEEWLVDYADAGAGDAYTVEEGFGDYHLARRNRAAEARDLAKHLAREAEKKRRAATPPVDLLREAMGKNDEHLAGDVLREARRTQRSSPTSCRCCSPPRPRRPSSPGRCERC
jgi:hypothetical protein